MPATPLPQAAPAAMFSFEQAAARAQIPSRADGVGLSLLLVDVGMACLLRPQAAVSGLQAARQPQEQAAPSKSSREDPSKGLPVICSSEQQNQGQAV